MPSFTILSELKADWPRIVARIPHHYRGYVSLLKSNDFALYSRNYNTPVIAIQHKHYKILNRNIRLLNSIAAAVNAQLVHHISGVRFIEPLSKEHQDVIDLIVDKFDAEIIDVD